ncbi:hypothetical protein STEG23_010015 [Scotinomys teguina]
MTAPWRRLRSLVWEYWAGLLVCAFWIPDSRGMPHVIRIEVQDCLAPFGILYDPCVFLSKYSSLLPAQEDPGHKSGVWSPTVKYDVVIRSFLPRLP